MATRYLLSITSLLDSTRDVHQKLFFQTRLLPDIISHEECFVQIGVYNGNIVSCEIKEEKGRTIILELERIIGVFKPLGILEWYRVASEENRGEILQEQHQQTSSSIVSSHSADHQVPVRQWLNGELPQLDLAHRRVFSLVDGTRSVQQIAKLLGKQDTKDILRILRDLQNQNLVKL